MDVRFKSQGLGTSAETYSAGKQLRNPTQIVKESFFISLTVDPIAITPSPHQSSNGRSRCRLVYVSMSSQKSNGVGQRKRFNTSSLAIVDILGHLKI